MEEDFFDKKERFVSALENYLNDGDKEKLINKMNEFKEDEVLMSKELIKNINEEILKYLDELSRKDLKQRILLVKSYLGD